MLTISDYSSNIDLKPTVLVMARQHPGESPASFTVEGVIGYLLGKNKEAEFLRQKFVFRVVPMMNVDGIVFGNYRASLTGLDPNRQWENTPTSVFPEISAVKDLVSRLSKKGRLKAVFDIHSHSRKMKSFFYGVNYPNRIIPRMLPFFCSRMSKDISF
jgi:murein tripeptide amidase MpaA